MGSDLVMKKNFSSLLNGFLLKTKDAICTF